MKWFRIIEGEDNCVPNFFMATKYELFGRDWDDVITGMHISNWNPEPRLWSGVPK